MFLNFGFDNSFFRPRILDATGTVAGIGVAAAGSSAAAMTSTLATIGCGSMAAGIGVVAAAPLAVGGIVYGLWKLFSDD